uniref:C2H2-type domain-containing protein n=1 Tax=Streptomyces phage Geonosis TaxID=3158856 RepID=A0AAU7GWV1_9CAUD
MSSRLKCPYCPETRPSHHALTRHVEVVHKPVSAIRRTLDLRNPQTVEDVTVTGPELAEPITIESSEQAIVVQCVCGAPIEPLDKSTEHPDWTHVFPAQAALRSGSKCTDAIPAAGMPTKADRESLDVALARTGAGLAVAGREMAEMRAALDNVDERMRKLNAQLTSPATVRRATLNQVWDRLLDAGDLTGAAIVMKMIKAVVDDA